MRQLIPLKRRFTSTRLHGVILQKAVIFILASVKTWNLTNIRVSPFFIICNNVRVSPFFIICIFSLLLCLIIIRSFLVTQCPILLVSTVTRLEVARLGSTTYKRRDVSVRHHVHTPLGPTQPPIQRVSVTLPPYAYLPGREASSSSEAKSPSWCSG
jgi:hypothetical protein